ncbi:MAG TPA: NAD(P)/FAD-dependent oxidoreductase [Terrimesophilobacter sp.]|jgi:Predicted flavoprotein involved in K+ transport|uniref:flavin-containing monooxygenase n=1 Tax=Terrimesophilobacter sp. TaxID=2906435 RepID=UPI002F950E65
MPDDIGTVIVGAGQAGLAMGRELARRGEEFVILDERAAVGDVWRERWDSLTLFTPAGRSALPGLRFPGPARNFPTRDEVADYFAVYAAHAGLPVRHDTAVTRVARNSDGFLVHTNAGPVAARHVVIATGSNQHPSIPGFSRDLDTGIAQLHSAEYRNPSSIAPGPVLVVGAGTSGTQLAIELASSHPVTIAGRPTIHVPDAVLRWAPNAYWALANSILTRSTPIGRKVAGAFHDRGAPLINVSVHDLDRAGVRRAGRIEGVRSGTPVLERGVPVETRTVLWATGYRPDFSWIDGIAVDARGWPLTRRGVAEQVRGLYFLGMPFQYALTSGLIGGVGRDAVYLADAMVS